MHCKPVIATWLLQNVVRMVCSKHFMDQVNRRAVQLLKCHRRLAGLEVTLPKTSCCLGQKAQKALTATCSMSAAQHAQHEWQEIRDTLRKKLCRFKRAGPPRQNQAAWSVRLILSMQLEP